MTKRLSKKTIGWAIAASFVMACIVALVGVLALGPQRKALKTVEARISDVEDQLINPNTKGQSSVIDALKDKLSSAIENTGKYIVSPEQAFDLTVAIGKIANQAELRDFHSTHRKTDAYPINECQLIREGRIQLNFKSSFSQFARFLNLLERNEPVIFIDYFKIERSGENGMHSVDMVLTFFCGQNSLADVLAAATSH